MARAAAYVLTAWAILPMAAQRRHATLLSALLMPGQSITVGDLTFSDFTYLGGGDMPTAGAINVVPSTSGDAGLLFQGAFVNMAGGVGFDAIFGYRVTALSGMTITGAELAGNPSNTGLGSVALTEVFTPQIGTLGIFSRSPGDDIDRQPRVRSPSHFADRSKRIAGGSEQRRVHVIVLHADVSRRPDPRAGQHHAFGGRPGGARRPRNQAT